MKFIVYATLASVLSIQADASLLSLNVSGASVEQFTTLIADPPFTVFDTTSLGETTLQFEYDESMPGFDLSISQLNISESQWAGLEFEIVNGTFDARPELTFGITEVAGLKLGGSAAFIETDVEINNSAFYKLSTASIGPGPVVIRVTPIVPEPSSLVPLGLLVLLAARQRMAC